MMESKLQGALPSGERERARARARETIKGRREREIDDQEQEEGRGARVQRKLDSIRSARLTQERRAGGRDVGRRGERSGARGGQGRVVNAPALGRTGKSIGAACTWAENGWTTHGQRERDKHVHACLHADATAACTHTHRKRRMFMSMAR